LVHREVTSRKIFSRSGKEGRLSRYGHGVPFAALLLVAIIALASGDGTARGIALAVIGAVVIGGVCKIASAKRH
jgi:hypothetical protein